MTPFSGISRKRPEDERFLRGSGQFVDDLTEPNQLHSLVLRSPHAHARIAHIDISQATNVAGVAAIYTVADLRAAGLGDIPCVTEVATVAPLIIPPRPALADGLVRHVGDPVAFIVATSLAIARYAAEAIVVTYEPLPAVTDGYDATLPGAPQLWAQAPSNISYRFQKGDRDRVAAAFSAARHVVSLDLVNNRVSPAPLEPRAALAQYDPGSGQLTLRLTGQGVHAIRDLLAEHIFHIPPAQIHLIAPDVGGGFGGKNFLYPEWILLLFAALALRRPVRWTSERGEDFLSSAHGRDNRSRARLALDPDGRILAMDVATIANLGAYLSPSGPGSSTNAPGTAMGGLYDIPAVFMDVRGVFTNTVPIDAYRGAGKPEANYLIERLIDHAARELNLDPIALRRRNLIATFPYRTAMGMTIDCGRFHDTLDRVLQQADYAGFPQRRTASEAEGKIRGIGLACFLETSRGAPGEMAGVRFEPEGRIALVLGTQSNGQGHETSFPQIAADRLGLDPSCFRLVQADTSLVPRGKGHGGARSMHMGGAALILAIDAVIAKARLAAAALLQCAPEQLHFTAGGFEGEHGARVGLLDMASSGETLDCLVDSDLALVTFPNGCHVAEVEIDRQTGLVTLARYTACDDYGRLINPMLTIGQVQGGLAQGIGQALFEGIVHDGPSGQLLTASFMDYNLPRADHLPEFDIAFLEVATASNPLGVKGAGQAGCIAAPPTIMNAVLNALRHVGVTKLDMPGDTAKNLERDGRGREYEVIAERC